MRQHQLAPHRVDVPPTHMFTRPAAVQLHSLMQLRTYVPVVIGKLVLESSTRASLCTSCNPKDPCASPSPTALLKVSTRATLRRSCSSIEQRAGCSTAELCASCRPMGLCVSPSPRALLESSTRASLCTSCNPMDPCASPGPTALLKVSTRATLRRSCSSIEQRAGCSAAELCASCAGAEVHLWFGVQDSMQVRCLGGPMASTL